MTITDLPRILQPENMELTILIHIIHAGFVLYSVRIVYFELHLVYKYHKFSPNG